MQYNNNYPDSKNPFQSFLMAGFECAEVRGTPEYPAVIGSNVYFDN